MARPTSHRRKDRLVDPPATSASPRLMAALQCALDLSESATVVLDARGRVLHANTALADLLGRSTESLLGVNIGELVDAAATIDLAGTLREMAAGRSNEKCLDLTLITAGELSLHLLPVGCADDVCDEICIVGQFRPRLFGDGSEPPQRDVADALRESQARFHDAFQHAPIGMALTWPDGRFAQVNRAFCRIVRQSEEELLGTTTHALTHPQDTDSEQSMRTRLLAQEIPFYHLEKRLVNKHGHNVWVLESMSVVRDQRGQPLHMLCQIQDITDRKRAQEILLDSEVMFRSLLESAPDAIVLINEAGQIQLLNAQAEAMFGYERDELIGKAVEGLLSPRFHDLHVAHRVEHFSSPGKRPIGAGLDLAARRKDGTEFPVEISLSPLAIAERQLAMTIIRDVTERKKAAAELQQRARQEAAIAEFGRRAVSLSDLDLLLSQATEQVAQTLEVELAAVLELQTEPDGETLVLRSVAYGRHARESLHSAATLTQSQSLGSFAGHAVRLGQPVAVQNIADETRFDPGIMQQVGMVSGAAVPLKLHNRPYGVLAAYSRKPREFSTEDIHFLEAVAYLLTVAIERKRAEDALRRDRDFARSLIETAQAVVLVLDNAGKIVRFNPYTEELTGYRLEDVEGADWVETFVPPGSRVLAQRVFQEAAAGGLFSNAIHTIVTKQGIEHEIKWSGRALKDEYGAPLGVLFIGHDISELREAQKKLLESERLAAIGQMASGLAHESRNALQQIGACSEMLTMELAAFPEALDLVVGVQEAEARLHRLFEDVRAYAIPLRLDKRKVSVSDIWRKAWSQLAAARPEKNAQLIEQCEAIDVFCAVDAPAMELAFSNIFENAFDAATENLEVVVHCQDCSVDDRPGICLSFKDNGPGMTAEQHQRVLDPFYTTKTQGTGLGMSIVQRIVHAHRGSLRPGARSGKGAEFIITLPRDAWTSGNA